MKDLKRTSKATVKLEPEVHAWLSLLAEKYNTTLSGAIHKLIADNEPEVIRLQNEIESLKHKHLNDNNLIS